MELGWRPDTFWRGATVPEFWAGVDWLAERNAEQAEEIEHIRAAHRRSQPPADGQRVTVNPDMRIAPNPAFVEWRDYMRQTHGV